MNVKFVECYIVFLLTISLLACNRHNNNQEQEQDANTSAVTPNSSSNNIISAGKAGLFAIGQALPTADTLGYSVEKEVLTRYTEEGPETDTVFTVANNGTKLLTLYKDVTNSSKIGEIMIQSDAYQTKENIGVGSTITDFIKAYSDYKLWYTYVSDRYILETPQYPSVQFLLRKEDFISKKPNIKSEITPLQVTDFELDAKIESVRIY